MTRLNVSCLLAFLVAVGAAGSSGRAAEPPEGTGAKAVIVDADEPGDPLVVRGVVYDADGVTPVAGASIYVYQTDRNGIYDRTGDEQHPYRIGGWMISDDAGRYEFRTIRPGPYPEQRVPAHIHYVVRVGDGAERRFELRFEGDPYLRPERARREIEQGRFGSVCRVAEDADGTPGCVLDLRLDG
jgi:protocatechuate 3,4-dioxygenase beta subunit